MAQGVDRRQVLEMATACGYGLLSGCQRLGGGSKSPSSTESFDTSSSRTPTTTFQAESHDKLIGAHYYPWYGSDGRHWREGYANTPTLGEYDSASPDVIDQHIRWARQYGVNWFSVSWWGADDRSGRVLELGFEESRLGDEIALSVLYESTGRLSDGDEIDVDDRDVRERLNRDFSYLEENLFGKPNYLTIRGRPVVFMWATNSFVGDLPRAIGGLRDSLDTNPFFISDMLVSRPPLPRHTSRLPAFDAVTTYNPYEFWTRQGIEGDYAAFLNRVERVYTAWHLAARDADTSFIPSIIPGYDKTESSRGGPDELLPRTPDRFTRFARRVRDWMDPDLDAVLITSFNEWHEGTTIEPGEEYGTTYLEIVSEELATATPDYRGDRFVPMELVFNKTMVPMESDELSSPDPRPLAFQLSELTFYDGSGAVVATYDIGIPESEPYFTGGQYGATEDRDSDLPSWRWLGGPEARCRLYVDPVVADAVEAEVKGRPVLEDEIQATVFFDGREVTTIRFDGRRGYRFPLS